MASGAPELQRIQQWMLTVVMNPDGATAGVASEPAREIIPTSTDDLDEVVLPSASLTSMERLGIYANMYYWRLIDVLAADFSAVKHALGWDDFERTARAYVAAHPSRFFSLSHLGRGFAAFIAEEAEDLEHREFVADVARVESACDEVFDAARSPRLAPDELDAVAPEAWGNVRLVCGEAVALLELDWPANAFVQAVRDEKEPPVPAPGRTWLLVRRAEDYTVWRADLTREQYHLLAALRAGSTLGEALASAAALPDVNIDDIMSSVGPWFRKWTAQGIFATLDGPALPATG